LPDKSAASALPSAQLLEECAKLPSADVNLFLPKFRLEPPTISLAETLQSLGMKAAFDIPQGSANFDAMAPRKPDDYLYISDVFHKTFFALDEKGVEAAAATAIVMMRATSMPVRREPVEVRVDRPFFFAIQHISSSACLFLGRMSDPS
ncbi:MAG: serpin family protein, partial [Terrimicrobiaceae bacterium]